MSFEKDYTALKSYTQLLRKRYKISASVDDIINSAYIKFYETGKFYNGISFRKIISSEIFKELDYQTSTESIGVLNADNRLPITGDNTCTICKETKPISQFKISKGKWVGHQCRLCLLKHKSSFSKNWSDKRRKKWNNYMRERYKKSGRLSREEYDKFRASKNPNAANIAAAMRRYRLRLKEKKLKAA